MDAPRIHVTQTAAEAEKMNATCTEPTDGGGISNAKVKPRGGNGQDKKRDKGENNPRTVQRHAHRINPPLIRR